ncbi:hypothetical protein [Paractinoplanes maris]|uniref:hypothetical protein n=1 Tax=Paractinoplanes maris TaxID=1734446 RepID=UPI002020DF58|nr:hypothetical protein [Actinoplanes maris]
MTASGPSFDHRRIERIFRNEGLPALVRDARPGRSVLSRTMPFLQVAAMIAILGSVAVLGLRGLLNPDVWQVAWGVGPGRLALTMSVFAVVAFMTGIARTRELSETLTREHESDTAAIPWPARAASGAEVLEKDRRVPELTEMQRANLALAVTGRQLAQALWLGIGIFIMLFLLGLVLVPPVTGKAWIGTGDADQYVGRPPLLISVTMIKVAVLLAGFSMLYFIVVTAREEQYRRAFYGPLAHRLHRLLQLHAAYSVYVGPPVRSTSRLGQVTRKVFEEMIATARDGSVFGPRTSPSRRPWSPARQRPTWNPAPPAVWTPWRVMRAMARVFVPLVAAQGFVAFLNDLPRRWDPDDDPLFRATTSSGPADTRANDRGGANQPENRAGGGTTP